MLRCRRSSGSTDGRGPATLLTELVLDRLSLASPTALIREIYDRDVHRRTITSLASIVQTARDRGDAVAADILTRAGGELAAAASSVITRLEMRGDVFPTLLSGGIFRAVPWLAGDVTRRISEVAPRSEVRLLTVEPAVGAVRLAIATAQGRATVPSYI